jgi:hypothetical protein
MKTFWFLVLGLWSSSVLGQLQKFEDLAALYDLNQNEIEQTSGFSCRIHINYVMVGNAAPKADSEKTYTVVREQYLRLVEKGSKRRVDSISGEWRSELGSGLRHAPPGLRRNDLQIGEKDLTLIDEGVADRPLKFYRYGFWQSVFHLPQLWASGITYWERWPKEKAAACVQQEVNGKTRWHALLSQRTSAIVVVHHDEVDFLPVALDYFDAPGGKPIDKNTFNGVDKTWKKTSQARIQWEDLGSGLYGPKSLSIHTDNGNDHTMSIYFSDWKIGKAVDSSLLDEAEFRKLDKKKFPYGDLIKAFPEHPPTVLK